MNDSASATACDTKNKAFALSENNLTVYYVYYC